MKMVAQMYGAQIQNEVINHKVGAAFSKAVQDNGLQIAGAPRFEEKTGDDVAQDEVAFYAIFEVILKSRLAIWERLSWKKPLPVSRMPKWTEPLYPEKTSGTLSCQGRRQ